MPIIDISVQNKIATAPQDAYIICGNSNYVINFTFDAEWDEYNAKTARFKYNGVNVDVPFTGNQCRVPIISNSMGVEIGVYSGTLTTTTGAMVECKKSVLCDGGLPQDPEENVYLQIIKLINELQTGGTSEEDIAAAVAAYMAENPVCNINRVESLDEENLINLRDLESGTYVLYGYFRPFAGSDTVLTFPNNLAVGIVTKTAGTHVQIPYPVNNCIQFLEITDESYERKDVYLNDYEIHVTKAEDGTYTTDAEFSDVVYNHNRGRRVVFYVDDLNGAELMAENFTDTIISAAAIYNQDGAQYTATVEFNADNTVTVYIKSCEEEINKLSEVIADRTDRIYSEIPVEWTFGNISSATGNESENTSKARMRSGFVYAEKGDSVFTDAGAQVVVYLYDAETQAFVGAASKFGESHTLADNAYIRLVGRNPSNGTITDISELSKLIHISKGNGIAFVKRYLLKSDTDLNTLTQNGIYNCSAASLPSNTPETTGGIVIVQGVNTAIKQTYTSPSNTYIRYSTDSGATWKDWTKIAIDPIAMVSRRLLTNTDDLNDVKQIGVYRYSVASLPQNIPVNFGGVLVVNSVGIAIEQVYYGVDVGYVRHSGNSGESWNAWVKLYSSGDTAIQQLPVLSLTGDTTAMSKDNAVTLNYTLFDASGECTCKWQGSSSQRYAKKNYTIKFDTGLDGWNKWATFINSRNASTGNISRVPTESRWGEQKKFCTKANWVDPSHARNIVCARLWGQVVQNRIAKGEITDNRTAAPNYGAIDGFPIEITINGQSIGLYTFNIPKDGWQFAMGTVNTEYVVSGEDNSNQATRWKALAALDETDFSVEYAADGVDTETVRTSLNTAIQAAIDAGADWETTLAPYVDINSVFDYFIFTCCISNIDAMARNILYGTYDGTKWFMSAYDMDTTFGLDPYGTSWHNIKTDRTQFAEAANMHRLAYLVYTYSKDKLAARYKELRETVLSEANVWHELSQFIVDIPSRNYDIDRNIWATMPGTSCANMAQYMEYYRMHCAYLDKEIAAFNQQ